YHVFETARRLRVRRVVHVSSLMVSWGPAMLVADDHDPPLVPGDGEGLPVGTYALTKTLGERIAAHYAFLPGMAVILKAYGGRQFDIRRLARPKYPMEVIT